MLENKIPTTVELALVVIQLFYIFAPYYKYSVSQKKTNDIFRE